MKKELGPAMSRLTMGATIESDARLQNKEGIKAQTEKYNKVTSLHYVLLFILLCASHHNILFEFCLQLQTCT